MVNIFKRQFDPNIQSAMLKKIYRFRSALNQDKLHKIECATFLIVHSMPSGDDHIRVFGEKLCQAIQLSKQELGLLTVKDNDFFDFGELNKRLSNAHLLWMTNSPEYFFPNMAIKKYKWLDLLDLRLLVSDPAEALMSDKKMKGLLWNALKNEFL